MAKTMLEELKSESSVVSMRLTRRSMSSSEATLLLALVTTEIPGEVRAKYLREQDVSTVHADVHVDAVGTASLELHAMVRVELVYQGDMVRSSGQTRRRVGNRLQELAQRRCAETVLKEVARA